MNVGDYNGKPPNNSISLWLLQCSYINMRCHSPTRFKPDLLYVQGLPYQSNPPIGPNRNITIQFSEFIFCNDRFWPNIVAAKTNKYQPLLDRICAKNWSVAPLMVLTTGACASTHTPTMTLLHDQLQIPKPTIKQTCIKINTIAIHHTMSILLHKHNIENNQPLPALRPIINTLKNK
jgi:hypothetical protein